LLLFADSIKQHEGGNMIAQVTFYPLGVKKVIDVYKEDILEAYIEALTVNDLYFEVKHITKGE